MSKILIDCPQSELDPVVIESKLRSTLASFVDRLNVIHVTIQLRSEVNQPVMNYRCEIEGIDLDSKHHIGSQQHGSVLLALEGALRILRCKLALEECYA